MATRTLGTNLTTSLTAIAISAPGAPTTPYVPSTIGNEQNPADVAALLTAIKNDQVNVSATGIPQVVWPGVFAQPNLLTIPNRGVLRLYPGDFIAWDSVTGWPILLSGTALAATGTLWTHT
jgi:hypothetical protein